MAYCSAITLAAAIPVFYLLISNMGILGGVWSVFAVNLFRAFLMGWFANSINHENSLSDLLQLALVVSLGVVFYLVAYFIFKFEISIVGFVLKFVLVALFPFTILMSPLASSLIRQEVVGLLLNNRWAPKRFKERKYV